MYILKKPGSSSLRTELLPPSQEIHAPFVEMLPGPPFSPFGTAGLLYEADSPAGSCVQRQVVDSLGKVRPRLERESRITFV